VSANGLDAWVDAALPQLLPALLPAHVSAAGQSFTVGVLQYEVNSRPAWMHIPLRGILRILGGRG
jgi:hypothetical protein